MAVDETVKKSTFREYYEALRSPSSSSTCAHLRLSGFKIPTGSMEDNLKVGDHIIVNKFIYGPGTSLGGLLLCARSGAATHRLPLSAAARHDFVKRVIGLPGDSVEIHDKVVSINGRPMPEQYVIHVDPTIYPPRRSFRAVPVTDQFGPVIVPEGQYFAMGTTATAPATRVLGTVPRSMIKAAPSWSIGRSKDAAIARRTNLSASQGAGGVVGHFSRNRGGNGRSSSSTANTISRRA